MRCDHRPTSEDGDDGASAPVGIGLNSEPGWWKRVETDDGGDPSRAGGAKR